jgi:hypothetical protein
MLRFTEVYVGSGVIWGWEALHETKEKDDADAPDCACVQLDAGYVDEGSYSVD